MLSLCVVVKNRHIISLLLFLYPMMATDNNTYDYDTQIQEQLTDYYEAHTNHNLDTSTSTDLRLSPEIVQWAEDQDIVSPHTWPFITLEHQRVPQTVNDLLARPVIKAIQVDDTLPITDYFIS